MAGKKMEGNEEQRRKKTRQAKQQRHLPSEEGVTMRASKQRRHLRDDEDLRSIHRGKQPDPGLHVSGPEPRASSG
jgi:hypothetical protein